MGLYKIKSYIMFLPFHIQWKNLLLAVWVNEIVMHYDVACITYSSTEQVA